MNGLMVTATHMFEGAVARVLYDVAGVVPNEDAVSEGRTLVVLVHVLAGDFGVLFIGGQEVGVGSSILAAFPELLV